MNLHCFLSMVVVCTFASVTAADEVSHGVMQHWVGDWTGGVARADGGAGDSAEKPAKVHAVWALDDRFVHATNSDADGKAVGIWLMRFDAETGKYQVWYFTAALGASRWDGTWSEADQTMTWKGEDLDGDWKLSGYTKFVGDKQEWKLEIAEGGKVRTESGSLVKE